MSTESERVKGVTAEAVHAAPRRFSLGNVRTFASLKNPHYLLYFASTLCHQAAQNMQQMSRGLLVYRLTGSATTIGIMSLAGAIPHLVTSLFGGVAADRFQKKYVLIVGMSMFSLVALGLGLSLTTGLLTAKTWWLLVIAAVMHSSLMGLIIPARSALVREIVGRETLMNALSLNQIATGSLRMLAPAIAGFVIDLFGFEAVFYTMAILNALSAITIAFLPTAKKVAAKAHNAITELVDGFKYIRSQRNILFLLIITLFGVILAAPFQQMMPVFVDDVLKVGAKGMGILLSISGIGAIAASFILASLPNKRRGAMLLGGMIILGVALITFSFSKIWTLSLFTMVAVGMGQTLRGTLSNTLVQTHTEDQYRGRVMGVYDMEHAFTSLATFTAAVITETASVQWAIGGLAILLVVISVAALAFVPRLRKME